MDKTVYISIVIGVAATAGIYYLWKSRQQAAQPPVTNFLGIPAPSGDAASNINDPFYLNNNFD